MNQEITVELQFFFISVLWGAIILMAYDVLRILRRLIKHGTIIVAAEDLLFWIAASVFIFSMIYRQNNGIIRGFSVMGMTIGMLLYHLLMKDIIVEIIVKGIRTLLRPVALALHTVKRGVLFLLSKVKKAIKFLLKQLKKRMKSVKIAVNKRTQVLSERRKERLEKKAALRIDKKRKPDSKKNKSNTGAVTYYQPSAAAKPLLHREHTLVFERVSKEPPVQNNMLSDNTVTKENQTIKNKTVNKRINKKT